MNRFRLIQRPKGNWLSAKILIALFDTNERWLRSREIRQALWQLIKAELFYVGGKCQHSGFCCQKLSVYHNQTPIRDMSFWRDRVKSAPKSLERFKPVMRHGQIQYFNCSCLTRDNKCSEYATRPQFCRAYPFSNYLVEAPFYEECGYSVQRTQLRPKLRHKRLQRLVRRMDLIYNTSP